MKRILKSMFIVVAAVLMTLLVGCADNSFATITEEEVFASVPLMTGEKITFSEVKDMGAGELQVWAYDTSLAEYKNYLTLLEEEGFVKYTDNGEEGLEGYVYTAHYQKDTLLVVITYYTQLEDATVTVSQNTKLSEHLIYDEAYVADNKSEAKTTLTMPELYTAGNSFVFQLKNGNFIINDGGDENDVPYLLDYLDSLTDNGEKPVIEAWVISHSHQDHMGVLIAFQEQPELCNRIYVENVYFTEASSEAHETTNASISALTFYSNSIPSLFKSTEGDAPNVYRMREGERYYFNDITMDVVYEQSLLLHDEWKTWNATSTALMYTVEGQKVFLTADIDYECQMVLLDIFPDEYFNIDVYQTPHHGGNVYNVFTNHMTLKTVLYARHSIDVGVSSLQGRWTGSLFLQSKAEEVLDWGTGGIRLTFPYEVGTYEKLPMTEWKYNDEIPKRLQNK